MDAVASAITPSVKKSHTIVDNGATSILIRGDHNNVVFNRITKDHVNSSIQADEQIEIEGSVGRINANRRSGGIYVFSLKRVVPFEMSDILSKESEAILLTSLSDYSLNGRQGSGISLTVLPTMATDRRVKKYLVLRARKIPTLAQMLE